MRKKALEAVSVDDMPGVIKKLDNGEKCVENTDETLRNVRLLKVTI